MENHKKLVLSSVFILSAALLASDMASDVMAGASALHIIEEVLVMFLLLFGTIFIWKDNFALKNDLARTQQELEKVKKESLHWLEKNQTHIQGLSNAIDHQLQVWQLTQSEKEIALLLIKGLSMKEIASIRETSEKTVRQQSLAIYTKSKLTGRAELSAFFLEDLLGPSEIKTKP